MELGALGFDAHVKAFPEYVSIPSGSVGRVFVHHKKSYLLYAEEGELEGVLRGKFLKGMADSSLPRVGDFVTFSRIPNERKAVIEKVLPRRSVISRKSLEGGKRVAASKLEEQIIAANVDIAFIVQAMDETWSVGRIERYAFMAKEGNVAPVVLLNKADNVIETDRFVEEVEHSLPGIPVFAVSAKMKTGLESVKGMIKSGTTIVFLGPSGAGKSSLINTLTGLDIQKTGEVREIDSRGRHTTTKRELLLFPGGGILIDTPGMRELGLWTLSEEVVAENFSDIEALATECKFRDCDHEKSEGCAVRDAVEKGKLTREKYFRYIKIVEEMDAAEKREVIKRRRDKK